MDKKMLWPCKTSMNSYVSNPGSEYYGKVAKYNNFLCIQIMMLQLWVDVLDITIWKIGSQGLKHRQFLKNQKGVSWPSDTLSTYWTLYQPKKPHIWARFLLLGLDIIVTLPHKAHFTRLLTREEEFTREANDYKDVNFDNMVFSFLSFNEDLALASALWVFILVAKGVIHSIWSKLFRWMANM